MVGTAFLKSLRLGAANELEVCLGLSNPDDESAASSAPWYPLPSAPSFADDETEEQVTATSTATQKTYIVDLDRILGNDEGAFDVEGMDFSHSARNVRLEGGNRLFAQLARSNGVWLEAGVALDVMVPSLGSLPPSADDGGLDRAVFTLHFLPDETLRRQAWRRLRLLTPNLAVADCRLPGSSGRRRGPGGGTYVQKLVDLDEWLGNWDGDFDTDDDAADFSHSAADVHLLGSVLHARLATMEEGVWRSASIDLRGVLELGEDGELRGRVRRRRRAEAGSAPAAPRHVLVRDNRPSRQWGGRVRDATYVFTSPPTSSSPSVTTTSWLLLAQCQDSQGVFREDAFDMGFAVRGLQTGGTAAGASGTGAATTAALHNLVPRVRDMRVTMPDQGGGGDALRVRVGLNCGWDRDMESVAAALAVASTAPGKAMALAAARAMANYEWHEIDPAELVENRNGRLVLNRTGSQCESCSNLFRAGTFYTPKDGRCTPVDVAAVSSTRLQCALCRLLCDTTVKFAPSPEAREVWIEARPQKVVLVVRGVDEQNRQRFEQRFHVRVSPSGAAQRAVAARSAYDRFSSDDLPTHLRTMPIFQQLWHHPVDSWVRIKEWVATCTEKHAGCDANDCVELPSRYLDVGDASGSNVRVVTSQRGERGRYACLSHCWGGAANIYTLNAHTGHVYGRGIPPGTLPPVFEDAIRTCRALGIRFLWIDSLCILQDSLDDFHRESQRMGQYYSNCALCIAATSSKNSFQGAKVGGKPTLTVSAGHPSHHHPDSETKGAPPEPPYHLITLPFGLDEYYHYHRCTIYRALQVDLFPLLTRAWALQERLLAPRVLHICHFEAAFECGAGLDCECGQGQQQRKDDGTTPAGTAGTTTEEYADDDEVFPEWLHRQVSSGGPVEALEWGEIVTLYSPLKLTCPEDRLVALSGIASAKAEQYRRLERGRTTLDKTVGNLGLEDGEGGKTQAGGQKVRYLAGLWEHRLALDLGWFVGDLLLKWRRGYRTFYHDASVGGGGRREARPAGEDASSYLAPSWSWASVAAPVYHLGSETREGDVAGQRLFDLATAHVNLADNSADPHGSVAAGCRLQIRGGELLETSWEVRPSSDGDDAFVLTALVGSQVVDEADAQGVLFAPDYELEREGRATWTVRGEEEEEDEGEDENAEEGKREGEESEEEKEEQDAWVVVDDRAGGENGKEQEKEEGDRGMENKMKEKDNLFVFRLFTRDVRFHHAAETPRRSTCCLVLRRKESRDGGGSTEEAGEGVEDGLETYERVGFVEYMSQEEEEEESGRQDGLLREKLDPNVYVKREFLLV